MCKTPDSIKAVKSYGHELVDAFQQKVVFAKNKLSLAEGYPMLCLLNHNAAGGTPKDLEILRKANPSGDYKLYDVTMWVFVDGKPTDIMSQSAIFDGKPDLIKPEAVFDTLLMNAEDCEEYRINFTEGNTCYSDFPQKTQFDIDVAFSYKEKGL